MGAPTTYADWLLCNRPTPYWNGGWWDEINPGTSGDIELDLTNDKRDFGRLCLQAGDPSGYREIIVKDIYVSKESGATKSSILSSISGGSEVVVEKATESGVKAFDMESVDVSGYEQLIVAFSSPTIGEWNLNIDGNDEAISAGTQYYKVDVSAKTTLSNLTLSVGSDELPRVNNFYKLYLVNPVAISSTSDWDDFADAVNGGEIFWDAYLTADVNAGSTMIGTESNKYAGTFDGAGHTLSFTYDGAGSKIAPFNFTNGATIVDLKTTGSITSTGNCLGGIIGDAYGENQLIRCASDMTMTSNDSENGRVGGLVGRCTEAGNSITFTNCLYNGAISSAKADFACGFVGWSTRCTLIVSNCLVAPKSVTNGGKNFSDQEITIPAGKNAFYTTQFGSSTQGTKPTDAQLYNGYVAYTLSSDISDGVLFFGQGKLNSSVVELPSMTSVASKKVYKASNEALYANSDGLLPDPALSGKLAWKMAMTWDPIYFVTLPAASASDFNLYGSADSYILNVSSAGATTLVVPFNVEEANIPSGVKVYNLSFDGTDITATRVNSITANKPVLINAPEGEYRLESGIYYSDIINFSSYGTPTNGALTGVYNTSLPFSYVPEDAYVLQNGPEGLCFYQVDAENTIKITSFRAYLTADAGAARALSIKFPDDETAINKVQDSSIKVQDSEIFNLAGQRMSKLQKGVNIVNGKKIMVK